MPIPVTPTLSLEEKHIRYDFVRSSGPGGQNVNKVSTAVLLRFDAANAPMPPDIRRRLLRLAGSRATAGGVIVIQAQRFRTQEQNRKDALERLIALVRKAAVRPRARVPTRPTAASRKRRHEGKQRRSRLKGTRRKVSRETD